MPTAPTTTTPHHDGVLITRRSWVADRLRGLSLALQLPCPTRGGFLFRADDEFYRLCTESAASLQKAVRRVLDHLDLPCRSVLVSFEPNLSRPAQIERRGDEYFIEIDPRYRQDGPALGALLAHECCHVLLHDRRLPELGNVEDEVHVDLTAMLTGLGPLTLNGILDKVEEKEGVRYEWHRAFGYLPAHLLRFAYAFVASELGIAPRLAVRHVRDDLAVLVSFTGILNQRALRALTFRAPRLCFAPPEERAVVLCFKHTCGRRLRIPVGRRGIASCPECSSSFAIDARACRIRSEVRPGLLRYDPAPTGGLVRLEHAWHSMSLAGKAGLIGALGMLVWFAVGTIR
ncbi:MAG: hypothetical protein QM765_29840 [Myxococcales bacterium]